MKKISSALSWLNLSSLGESKIINRTYIYLILVPILAKFLSKVDSPVTFEIFKKEVKLTFELPFSWKMFFFGALCFTLASIFYKIFSPSIIKENKSFADFTGAKKSASHLFRYLMNLKIDRPFLEKHSITESILFSAVIQFPPTIPEKQKGKVRLYHSLYSKFMGKPNADHDYQTDFWAIHKHADEARFFWRILITLLYAVGFFLIGWVFVQSVYLVITI